MTVEKRRKVLVIDDSVVVLEVARWVLEKAGLDVFTLDNPLTAAMEIGRTMPDLVLIDINMPAIKGNLVAEVLLKTAPGYNRRIYLHSDVPPAQLNALALKAGVAGFISKTDKPEVFASQVLEKLQLLA